MKGGMIENWDLFEEILDYTLKKVGNQKFWDFLFTIQLKAIAQRIRISSPSYV